MAGSASPPLRVVSEALNGLETLALAVEEHTQDARQSEQYSSKGPMTATTSNKSAGCYDPVSFLPMCCLYA